MEPEGAYYVLVDIAESGCPVHDLIRFHFAKRPETLAATGKRLIGLRERAA